MPNQRFLDVVFDPNKKHPQNCEVFAFVSIKTHNFHKHDFGKYHSILSKTCELFYEFSLVLVQIDILSNISQRRANQREIFGRQKL